MTPTDVRLILAVDLSTSGCKVLAVGTDGKVYARSHRPLSTSQVGANGFEQDAASWWSALLATLSGVAGDLGESMHAAIAGICITHQRETYVLANEGGEALCPAVCWMDKRGGEVVAELVATVGAQELHRITGTPPCLTPSVYRLIAHLRRAPELKAAHSLLDVHGYLVWRLTGRRVSSTASMAPLGVVDLVSGDYSEDMLKLAGLSRSQVPELVEPGQLIGKLLGEVASAVGLDRVSVYAGGGDGQAAALGAIVDPLTEVFVNLGTAVVGGARGHEPVLSRGYRTMIGLAGDYVFETVLQGGALSVVWLVERVFGAAGRAGTPSVLEGLEADAAKLEPGSDGLMFLPYLAGVMNPHWDDRAGGAFVGLHTGHSQAHLYRAVLEGIALETTDQLEALPIPVKQRRRTLVLGGGSRSDLWLKILTAAMAPTPAATCRESEATALGAAVVGAVGAKLFANVVDAQHAMLGESPQQRATLLRPTSAWTATYGGMREAHRSIYPALKAITTKKGQG